MIIDVILPIILMVALIGTFIYLHLKKRKNSNVSLVIDPKDMIDYTPKQSTLSLFEMLLLDKINSHRRKIGAPELSPERECKAQAYIHTKYMIAQGEPSHDKAFERRYELFRRGFTLFGENVGYGYSTAKSFFNAYMKSDGHRAIIEEGKFTHLGIRAIQNKDGKYYNTLIFGRYEKNI